MPAVHRIAALLKRWLLGIHQSAVSGKRLDYYLDEFVFRFNRRTSRLRGMLFYRLIQQAVATPPALYRQIVDGNYKVYGALALSEYPLTHKAYHMGPRNQMDSNCLTGCALVG